MSGRGSALDRCIRSIAADKTLQVPTEWAILIRDAEVRIPPGIGLRTSMQTTDSHADLGTCRLLARFSCVISISLQSWGGPEPVSDDKVRKLLDGDLKNGPSSWQSSAEKGQGDGRKGWRALAHDMSLELK